MQRKAWFEIHDHPLFPRFLRDLVTEALEAMWNAQDFYGPVAARLRRALDESGATRVVDLCSGGGGPWLRFSRDLAGKDGSAPAVLLTDKYPNQRAFQQIQDATGSAINFYPEPVDAMRIPPELAGFRTMFSTFHHFGPGEARAILKDAFDQRQGIAVFEAAKCDFRTLAAVFAVPLLGLRLAPRIRPFRWGRIFWTYCLPAIPFTLWLDGLLSCLRSYSRADMRELVEGMTHENYSWEIGEERRSLISVRYLVGCPVGRAGTVDVRLEQMEMPAQQTPSGPVSSDYATAEVAFRR
jgi:hypothetical protein